MKSKQPLVVGVGLCALDYLIMVDRYPAIGAKIDAVDSDIQGGGPVPTAICALAKLGCRAAFIGKCGDDHDGREIIAGMQEFGVDTSGMVIDKNARSPRAFIWVEKGTGERTVVLDRCGIGELSPDQIKSEFLETCEYLLIDGREAEASLNAAAIAREHGAQVIFDAGSNRRHLGEILSSTDHLVGSASFARAIFPELPPLEAVRKLFNSGEYKAVVITLGGDGAVACSADGVILQPAFPVKVVDTTGAGDVFHGAYVYALSRGYDLAKRLKFAAAAAALKCSHIGGRKGIPSLEEVERLISDCR